MKAKQANPPARPSTVIIGSGIGGLATACRLAKAGHDVTVLEKNDQVGGRCNVFKKKGFTFDVGPSLLMMIDALHEFYTDMGTTLEKELPLIRLDPNYQIKFDDGKVLTYRTDRNAMYKELEAFEPGSAPRYEQYLRDSCKDYNIAWKHFINRNYDGPQDFLHPKVLLQGMKMKAFGTLYSNISKVFKDERLRQGFTFQSMYLGTSPFTSPAVYGILPYTELVGGIYFPKGGMYAITKSLVRLAEQQNVVIKTNAEVQDIIVIDKNVRSVMLKDGTHFVADNVVSNIDVPTTYAKFLGRKKQARKMRLSSSSLLLYLGVKKKFPKLLHHNVRLSREYRKTFEDLFDKKVLPKNLNYYVCIPSKTELSMAPKGCETVFVLLPVPNNTSNIDWKKAAPKLRDWLLKDMEKSFGMKDLRKNLVVSEMFTPDDFMKKFGMYAGNAFGVSHELFQSAAFRPNNVDPSIKNLYYVGASTNPGSGIPMVFISSKLVCQRILK